MQLVDITCPKCSATMKVNGELTKCICNFCGNEMLVDHQKTQLTGGFQFGYDQEMGRQQALIEIERQKQQAAEEKARKEQEARQRALMEQQRLKAEQLAKERELEKKNAGLNAFCDVFFSILGISAGYFAVKQSIFYGLLSILGGFLIAMFGIFSPKEKHVYIPIGVCMVITSFIMIVMKCLALVYQ